MENLKQLIELYNSDPYHIEYLDRIAPYIKEELLDLYLYALNLSLEAPFKDEINNSYQITIEILNKSLGLSYKPNGDLYIEEDLNEEA